jgi:hypothetical protein
MLAAEHHDVSQTRLNLDTSMRGVDSRTGRLLNRAALRVIATILILAVAGCNSPDCKQSIDDYCKTARPSCVTNWAQFHIDARATCATVADGIAASNTLCGGYNVALVGGVDTNTLLYYDPTTGQLVAAVFSDANRGSRSCVGGPSRFQEPTHCDFSGGLCGDAGAAD